MSGSGWYVLGGCLVALALWLWVGLRYRRWCELRIRRWADTNGYAVLRLEYRRFIPVLSLIPGLNLILWFFISPGTWYVRVQDDEGGQRAAYISFGSFWRDIPGGKTLVKWQ